MPANTELLRDVLKKIQPGQVRPHTISSVIDRLKKQALRTEALNFKDMDPDEGKGKDNTVSEQHFLATLQHMIVEQQENEELHKYIAFMESKLDGYLDHFLTMLVKSIKNSGDAVLASEHYTNEWLANLPFSLSGKLAVIATLESHCKPYNYTNPFWERCLNGDNDALQELLIPKSFSKEYDRQNDEESGIGG